MTGASFEGRALSHLLRPTAAPPASPPAGPASPPPGPAGRTVVPPEEPAAPGASDEPRALARVRLGDVLDLVGAALAALATTGVLFAQVLPVTGGLPFTLAGYLLFLLYYMALIRLHEASTVVLKDRLASVAVHSAAVLLFLALAVVIVFTLMRGSAAFLHVNFWTQDLSMAGPLQGMGVGGMAHAALGTLIMIFFALLLCIPLGLLCAVYLSEYPGPLARLVRMVVEAMTALPSIICGLFIYATFILMFGMPRSGFASSLAISIMILPIMIRSADVVLRLMPDTLKEAALATGASRWRTVWHVTLPTCRSGLATAIILGTARGIGETAPVLITAGYTTYYNLNPFSGPMVSLPLATFTLVKSPMGTQIARGFGAAAVLMVLVFLLFALGRWLGGRGAGVLSPAAAARAKRSSAALLARIEGEDAAAPAGAPAEGFSPPPGAMRPGTSTVPSSQGVRS